MRDFSGKTAFVTGGASGIGLALAEAFGRRGMNVFLADIESGALESAVSALSAKGVTARSAVCDVTRRAQVQAAAKAALAAFGKVHVVCNNAGVVTGGPVGEVVEGDWDWIIDVNLKGVINGVEVFAPLISAHGEGGHFVNTASMTGLLPFPTLEPYTATKAAVVSMSEGWAVQLAPRNIGVSILIPGLVLTRIGESRRNRAASYGGGEQPAAAADNTSAAIATGSPPAVVAARVVEAVEANELYVLAHPEYRAQVAERFEAILAAFDRAAASPVLKDQPVQGRLGWD
jgi:NAD(P)-dependent dehydrogenase (short-subunit alcohol dehydrogenase family)